jgi:hypothetical protein
MTKSNGAVIWEGPSAYDGKPMAAIITWKSKNQKTGDMAQVWFVPKGFPTERKKTVCGKCPMSKACYVVPLHGPLGVWKAYRAGRYPKWDKQPIGKPVRIGAWGDPATIPEEILKYVISKCSHGYTMYTHGQHTTQLTPTACLGMISVETKSQASHYQSQGYRTYRIVPSKDIPLLKGEMWCPYPRVQCKD